MTDHLLFLIVGLGAGAAYAAIGMAVVTTYRGTGVINIAQGAMAMWAAFVYDELRRQGDLVLPVGRVDLGDGLATWPALAAGVAAAAVLGLLLHLVVFRPLRSAPPLAKVVASVGVAITLQALVVLRFGTGRRAVPPALPDDPVRIGALSFSRDRIWFAALVVAIAVMLWAYGRFTRAGLATRAAAESERGAILLGYSPDRLAAATWVLSAVVGGTVAVFVSPSVGLEPASWTLMVVPGLACALLGRLTSVGVACAAGLALGAVESEITLLSARTWWPDWATVGVAESVPLLVIVAALFLLGPRLPARGSATVDPLPPVPRPRVRAPVVGALVAAGVGALLLTEGSYRFGLITSMIVALMALSLVVLTGLVGQISLAQAAFAGSAGFALSKVGTGLPFPLPLLVAALAATALGLLVAVPALRVRGVQLAVVTLAAGVAIENFVFENPKLTPTTGNIIPDPRLLGLDLGVRRGAEVARWQFGILVLLVLTLAALAVANLIRSGTGRALLAVRSNERAAASLGVDVAAAKLVAFGMSAFLAGLGGALIGYSRGQLSATSFGVSVSLTLLAFAYLGGITSVGGALVAGTLAPLGIGYVVLDRATDLGEHYLLVSGILLVATAVLNPGGIAGTVRCRVAAVRLRLAGPGAAAATAADQTAEAEHPPVAVGAPP
ncbi:MAG TPA: ABC transporter permease [Acidimicrobiales bacterium]|nr:ABC transporter permease [Acidimicrobiales bacterium]